MAKPHTPAASDRSFSQTVNAAVPADPFSERRSVIDRKIRGLLNSTPPQAILTAAIRTGSIHVLPSAAEGICTPNL